MWTNDPVDPIDLTDPIDPIDPMTTTLAMFQAARDA